MDKETLLEIIIKDLGEIESLVKSFQGKKTISPSFLKLTETKLTNVVEEFKMLNELNNDQNIASTPKTTEDNIKINIPEKKEVVKDISIENKPLETSDKKNIEPKEINTQPEVEIQRHKEKPKTEPIVKENISIKDKATEIEDGAKTIGESLIGDKKSVNDIIANQQESNIKKTLKGKPVNDLIKELGINDRFMFQRELFDGNSNILNQTLQQLNEMPNFKSAQTFIMSNFNWDNELEVTKSFYSYIERKFH